MAIKADEMTLRSLNKNVSSVMNEVASCQNSIDKTLNRIMQNIVSSNAKGVFENLKSKNLKIASSLVDEMNSLTSFLDKQMDMYEITEEKANNLVDNALREFEAAKEKFDKADL